MTPTTPPPQKPREVLYAEYALWAWTAWMFLFGLYQTWLGIPEIEHTLTEDLQGMFTATPQQLMEMAVGGYGLLALLSVWVVLRIGAGKNWARSSLMWGFVLEVLWEAMPPYHGIRDTLMDLPDLAFQAYALYLLYTDPGRGWFPRKGAKAAAG